MNFFVTGCAGFIGSHLCEALLRQGHAVVGLDNLNQFYDPGLKQQNLVAIEKAGDATQQEFIFYQGDVRHQGQVTQILRAHHIDMVLHLAAMAGVRPSLENPCLYYDVNVNGTVNLLEACKDVGIKDFVFASSSSVYGNNKKLPFSEEDNVDRPISPYAASKRAGEITCALYKTLHAMRMVTLRFFTVYGPRQRPDLAICKFVWLIEQGIKLPVYGDGSKSRDFTYIGDIVDGVLKAIQWLQNQKEPCFEVFNLGECQTTSVNTLIELLAQVMDRRASIQYLPDQPGDVQCTYADISKAKRVLGYNPSTSMRGGLKKYVEWVRVRDKEYKVH